MSCLVCVAAFAAATFVVPVRVVELHPTAQRTGGMALRYYLHRLKLFAVQRRKRAGNMPTSTGAQRRAALSQEIIRIRRYKDPTREGILSPRVPAQVFAGGADRPNPHFFSLPQTSVGTTAEVRDARAGRKLIDRPGASPRLPVGRIAERLAGLERRRRGGGDGDALPGRGVAALARRAGPGGKGPEARDRDLSRRAPVPPRWWRIPRRRRCPPWPW